MLVPACRQPDRGDGGADAADRIPIGATRQEFGSGAGRGAGFEDRRRKPSGSLGRFRGSNVLERKRLGSPLPQVVRPRTVERNFRRSGRGAGLNGGMPAEFVPCCIPDDGCIAAGLRLSLYSGCFWVVLAGIDPNRAVGSREAVSAYSRFRVHGRLRLETWDRGARGQRLGTGGSAEGLPPATSCGASSGGKPGRH